MKSSRNRAAFRNPAHIILASASPRRRELLAAAGFSFDVKPSSVDERAKHGESPRALVLRLAKEKALAATASSGRLPAVGPVVGVDTVVVIGGKILGKPSSRADAKRMLRRLSGKQHRVMSGVCLLTPSNKSGRWKCDARVATTVVKFRKLTEAEIGDYVASGEPDDKAGAYAIQGRASRFTEWIRGCYFNVVGLPVSLLNRMMAEAREASGVPRSRNRNKSRAAVKRKA